MTQNVRIKTAALLTALFLGAVSAAGVLTHSSTPTVSAVNPAAKALSVQPTPGAIPSSTREHESYD